MKRSFFLYRKGLCPIPDCGKVFQMGHLGIDEHVYRAHAGMFAGSTKPEQYAEFKRRFPRPWPDAESTDATAPEDVTLKVPKHVDVTDYTHSTYREKLLEHLFISELLQEAWVKRNRQVIEVLRSEIDASGYDVVLASGNVIRHVQLKASRKGARAGKQNVNSKLADKPAGCVIWMQFEEDEKTGRIVLEYLFFGKGPNESLPLDLDKHKPAKHTKANAQGVKALRPGIRQIPRSAFDEVKGGTAGVLDLLFGPAEQPISVSRPELVNE